MTVFELPRARHSRVKDGDSLVVFIDRGFRDYSEIDLRLYGLDTPEYFSGPPIEREAGRIARAYVLDWLEEADELADDGRWPLSLRLPSQSKYGDWLARVSRADGRELNRDLLTVGLARLYFGRRKRSWRDGQLEAMVDSAVDLFKD